MSHSMTVTQSGVTGCRSQFQHSESQFSFRDSQVQVRVYHSTERCNSTLPSPVSSNTMIIRIYRNDPSRGSATLTEPALSELSGDQ